MKAGARRVALDDFANRQPSQVDQTIDSLLDAVGPHVPGMIETLGVAAQPVDNPDGSRSPGDLSAAKTLLDFMSKALTQRSSRGTNEILKRIAAIRTGGLEAALAEPDDVAP